MKRRITKAIAFFLVTTITLCISGCGTNGPNVSDSEIQVPSETVTGFYVDEDSGKIIDAETGKETENTTLAVDDETGNIVDTSTGKTVQTKKETETVSKKVEEVASITSKTENVSTNNSSKSHTHSYTSETIAPTCTEKGYTKSTCKCGDVKKENYTNALGHSFGDYITELNATCIQEGKQVRICTRCGKKEEKTISKTSHTFGNWVTTKQPTTASKGQKQRTCSVCGYAETQDIAKLPAQQHSLTVMESEMLKLINEERAKVGLNSLSFDYERYICAEVRAKEISELFSHTRPNGKSFHSVYAELGIGFPQVCGENIQHTPHYNLDFKYEDDPSYNVQIEYVHMAHNNFMNSPGHKANILASDYTRVAIAFYVINNDVYVAQLFTG